jgi:hypothetical protein
VTIRNANTVDLKSLALEPTYTLGQTSIAQHKIVLRNGVALRRHCDSAHRGQFDDTCPACRELKSKMEVPSADLPTL